MVGVELQGDSAYGSCWPGRCALSGMYCVVRNGVAIQNIFDGNLKGCTF